MHLKLCLFFRRCIIIGVKSKFQLFLVKTLKMALSLAILAVPQRQMKTTVFEHLPGNVKTLMITLDFPVFISASWCDLVLTGSELA